MKTRNGSSWLGRWPSLKELITVVCLYVRALFTKYHLLYTNYQFPLKGYLSHTKGSTDFRALGVPVCNRSMGRQVTGVGCDGQTSLQPVAGSGQRVRPRFTLINCTNPDTLTICAQGPMLREYPAVFRKWGGTLG